MVCSQSSIELRRATYNSSMERIVTRGQGSGDSHGHILRTVENSCPSQHSKRIHCNWKSQMVQHQCGVHHVSFMKATEHQCISKINPSELLSQHELNIYGELHQIKVCADWFQATKCFFHWQQGENNMWNVSIFAGFLCNYAHVSINTMIHSGLTVVGNTRSAKSPCKGSSPFPFHQWPKTNLLYLKSVHWGLIRTYSSKDM